MTLARLLSDHGLHRVWQVQWEKKDGRRLTLAEFFDLTPWQIFRTYMRRLDEAPADIDAVSITARVNALAAARGELPVIPFHFFAGVRSSCPPTSTPQVSTTLPKPRSGTKSKLKSSTRRNSPAATSSPTPPTGKP